VACRAGQVNLAGDPAHAAKLKEMQDLLLAEMRRLEGARRETLEVRLQHIEDHVRSRGAQLPSSERQGCLAQLFGPLS